MVDVGADGRLKYRPTELNLNRLSGAYPCALFSAWQFGERAGIYAVEAFRVFGGGSVFGPAGRHI